MPDGNNTSENRPVTGVGGSRSRSLDVSGPVSGAVSAGPAHPGNRWTGRPALIGGEILPLFHFPRPRT